MAATFFLVVLIVVGIILGEIFSAAAVALKATLGVLAVVGLAALFLRLGTFISGRMVRALIVGMLGAVVAIALIATARDAWPWISLVPYLVLCGLGLDLLMRLVAGGLTDLPGRRSGPMPDPYSFTTTTTTTDLEGCCPDDDMKRIFVTEYDAWRAVYRSQQRFARGESDYETPLDHHYPCRFHDHWHVSSQPR